MNKIAKSSSYYDPRNGDDAVRVFSGEHEHGRYQPQKTNYFNVILIESGSGSYWADAAQFKFHAGSLLFFVPYQNLRLESAEKLQFEIVQFHANFLCVETFHSEVGCSGILFNDPYGQPDVSFQKRHLTQIRRILAQLKSEQAHKELAWDQAMLSDLKLLLIHATRRKIELHGGDGTAANVSQHPLLLKLKELIESHYCHVHAPAEYAKMLHVTPQTLGRTVREQLGTTPTQLIQARILTHAKWQLLHTLRPVKEIAHEVGFQDELYFSRLFKKMTGTSPTFFREFETEIRGGSNLSI